MQRIKPGSHYAIAMCENDKYNRVFRPQPDSGQSANFVLFIIVSSVIYGRYLTFVTTFMGDNCIASTKCLPKVNNLSVHVWQQLRLGGGGG